MAAGRRQPRAAKRLALAKASCQTASLSCISRFRVQPSHGQSLRNLITSKIQDTRVERQKPGMEAVWKAWKASRRKILRFENTSTRRSVPKTLARVGRMHVGLWMWVLWVEMCSSVQAKHVRNGGLCHF